MCLSVCFLVVARTKQETFKISGCPVTLKVQCGGFRAVKEAVGTFVKLE